MDGENILYTMTFEDGRHWLILPDGDKHEVPPDFMEPAEQPIEQTAKKIITFTGASPTAPSTIRRSTFPSSTTQTPFTPLPYPKANLVTERNEFKIKQAKSLINNFCEIIQLYGDPSAHHVAALKEDIDQAENYVLSFKESTLYDQIHEIFQPAIESATRFLHLCQELEEPLVPEIPLIGLEARQMQLRAFIAEFNELITTLADLDIADREWLITNFQKRVEEAHLSEGLTNKQPKHPEVASFVLNLENFNIDRAKILPAFLDPKADEVSYRSNTHTALS